MKTANGCVPKPNSNILQHSATFSQPFLNPYLSFYDMGGPFDLLCEKDFIRVPFRETPAFIRHKTSVPNKMMDELRKASVDRNKIKDMMSEMDPKMLSPNFHGEFTEKARVHGLVELGEWLKDWRTREDICRDAAESGNAMYLQMALDIAVRMDLEKVEAFMKIAWKRRNNLVYRIFKDHLYCSRNEAYRKEIDIASGFSVYVVARRQDFWFRTG